jgi:DNA-binding transcriptional ArsR family regulator
MGRDGSVSKGRLQRSFVMDSATTPRTMSLVQVRALAHPLRLRLLELLAEGPSTASRLAERLGESSGATSYHLRELAKAELVEEEADLGNARDRWWRRPERLMLAPTTGTPEERAAGQRVRAVLLERDEKALASFLRDEETLPDAWGETAFIGNWIVHMTAAELDDLSHRFLAMMDEYRRPLADRPEGARPVHLSYRGLPR